MEWETAKLGDLAQINYGYTAKASFEINGPKFLRITDIQDGVVNWPTVPSCELSESDFIKHKLETGDIVFARTGATTGKSFLINEVENSVAASYLIRLRLSCDKVLPEFVYVFFQTKQYWDLVEAGSTGSAQGGFNASKLSNLEINFPTLPEQKRIVALLDTVFADLEQTRAKTEQNLKNARELFDSYLQQVFIQKGDGWVETTLGNVAKFKNGLNFSQSSKGEELTIVGVKDFKSHFMVPFEQLNTIQIDGDLSEEYELKKNDIITVRSNGNKRLIGRCLLMGTPISKTSYSGFTIRIRLIEDNICPEFLTYYMKSSSTHELLINSGEGANISNLNQKILTALPVTYPSYEQQCELVKHTKTIETESNSLTRIYTEKLDSIDELKKSILQKAFSGELITTAN